MVSKETEQYYSELFEVFNMPGWKHIVEMVEKDLKALDSMIWSTESTDHILRLQGHRVPLGWVKNLPEQQRAIYAEIVKEEEEADEDDADL